MTCESQGSEIKSFKVTLGARWKKKNSLAGYYACGWPDKQGLALALTPMQKEQLLFLSSTTERSALNVSCAPHRLRVAVWVRVLFLLTFFCWVSSRDTLA